jgi:hypothetical protein
MKRLWIAALVVGLVLAMAIPALAGNHAKANGSVEWTSSGLVTGIYSEFSLHDREGDDVRGSYFFMTIPQAGGTEWRWITVECVMVDGDHAHWAGTITATNGSKLDAPIVGWVMDGGTPGSDGDLIGTYANPTYGVANCGQEFTGGGTVTSGNLTVMPLLP